MTVRIVRDSGGIKFNVKVVPKSSKNSMVIMDEGIIKLKITAPPVDGKANSACVKYLAEILDVSKKNVNIVSGLKSRTKTIEVTGNTEVLHNKLLCVLRDE